MIDYTLSGEVVTDLQDVGALAESYIARQILFLLRKMSQCMSWPLTWALTHVPGNPTRVLVAMSLYPEWGSAPCLGHDRIFECDALRRVLVDLAAMVHSLVEQGIAVRQSQPSHQMTQPYMTNLSEIADELHFSTEALAGMFYGRCSACFTRRGPRLSDVDIDVIITAMLKDGDPIRLPGIHDIVVSRTCRAYPPNPADSVGLRFVKSIVRETIHAHLREWSASYVDRPAVQLLREVPIDRGPAFRFMARQLARDAAEDEEVEAEHSDNF